MQISPLQYVCRKHYPWYIGHIVFYLLIDSYAYRERNMIYCVGGVRHVSHSVADMRQQLCSNIYLLRTYHAQPYSTLCMQLE